MPYQVFDNGHPCELDFPPPREGSDEYDWGNSTFEEFDDALFHARIWLGDAWGGSDDGESGVVLESDEEYDYSGYGDVIEIREV